MLTKTVDTTVAVEKRKKVLIQHTVFKELAVEDTPSFSEYKTYHRLSWSVLIQYRRKIRLHNVNMNK